MGSPFFFFQAVYNFYSIYITFSSVDSFCNNEQYRSTITELSFALQEEMDPWPRDIG